MREINPIAMSACTPLFEDMGWYQNLLRFLITPPKTQYTALELGPRKVSDKNHIFSYIRHDFELFSPRPEGYTPAPEDPRGFKIQCCHWKPEGTLRMPCIIYLHGNGSCLLSALDIQRHILPLGIALFAFDFSGSGKSEGDYCSLGWWEREDVRRVVRHLRRDPSVTVIGLWGRSMGAATSLLHGDRDPSIAAMVVDSPFESMETLTYELVQDRAPIVPGFAVAPVLAMLDRSCTEKANFSIYDLCPIEHVDRCYIPILFGAGEQDDFIAPHHAKNMYEKYAGEKELMTFQGTHNTRRPAEWFDKAAKFMHQRLTNAEARLFHFSLELNGEISTKANDYIHRPGAIIPIPLASAASFEENTLVDTAGCAMSMLWCGGRQQSGEIDASTEGMDDEVEERDDNSVVTQQLEVVEVVQQEHEDVEVDAESANQLTKQVSRSFFIADEI